jgi:D-alanyl-D-alanine carboxypeptidase (penicillin-binding protein 5/6)
MLAICACALACAAPAHAGAPPVEASAYLVLDARTGEVLAASHAHEHLQIASITKLMTVLLTLQHHKLGDIVAVDPRAASVGEESIFLQAGDRLTVHDLLEGALIQSANDAADALALSIASSYSAFAQLMNAKAAQLGMTDTHFVRPDGLDEAGEYSSAADVTKLARVVMRIPFVRETVAKETSTIAGGRTLHTWDDLLTQFPQTIGVKTGHTNEAGWCQVAAARGRGVTVYATLLGSPTRSERNSDLESLLVWGLAQFRVVPAVRPGVTYANARVPYGGAPLALVAAKPLLTVARLGRPLTQTVTAAAAVKLPVHAGAVLGKVEIRAGGRAVGTRPLVASRTIGRPGVVSRLRWYAGRTLHHLAHLL